MPVIEAAASPTIPCPSCDVPIEMNRLHICPRLNTRCWPWRHEWGKWEKQWIRTQTEIQGAPVGDTHERRIQERRCSSCGLYQRRGL